MKYDPEIHHRISIRLQGYDYAQPGLYFFTIVSQNRECLFGEIVNGGMALNEAGCMLHDAWNTMPMRFQNMESVGFIVMPNHIHGIIALQCRGEPCVRPLSPIRPYSHLQPHSHVCPPRNNHHSYIPPCGTCHDSLGRIIQAFKSLTTKEYIQGVKKKMWPPFQGRLWQRNFYERIIRDDKELTQLQEYIINNPLKWELDHENPACNH